jgi:hypothetical protein
VASTQAQNQPVEAVITILTEAPTISIAERPVASEATITVNTEAPTVVGTIDVLVVSAGSAAIIDVGTESPGLSGFDTTIYPGDDGVNTTDISINTGAPVIYITKWTKEPPATDNWTKETPAEHGWEKAAVAANSWRKK